MASSPATSASRVALRYRQSMEEPARGTSPQSLQSNPSPPPRSHPPPPNTFPLRDPNQGRPPETADRAPQARTEGRLSRMERGPVGAAMCTLCRCFKEDVELMCIFFFFTSLVAQNPLCAKACKREGTIKSAYCASEFGESPDNHVQNKLSEDVCVWPSPSFFFCFQVLTGKVTSLSPGPRGTLNVHVSLIKAYKAGRLTITQVGETMSVKLVSQCKKCPLFRRGTTVLDTQVFVFPFFPKYSS